MSARQSLSPSRLVVLLFLIVSCLTNAWISPTTVLNSRATSTRLFMAGGQDVNKGTVKWFDTIKGFGFIVPDDGSPDVFVHQTAIKTEGFRSLADGEVVEYRLDVDPNGRRKAINVTGPGGENVQGAPFRPKSDYESY